MVDPGMETLAESVDGLLVIDLGTLSDVALADHTLALRRQMDRLELAYDFTRANGLILEWINGHLEAFWPNGLALAV